MIIKSLAEFVQFKSSLKCSQIKHLEIFTKP